MRVKISALLKTIRWGRVLLLLVVPTLAALPYPLPTFEKVAHFATSDDPGAKQEVRVLPSTETLGSPVLSLVSDLHLFSMDQYICLDNRNKIYMDGAEVDSLDILEGREAGAQSISIQYPRDSTKEEVYTRKGETACVILSAGSGAAHLLPGEVRNAAPFSAPQLVQIEGGLQMKVHVYSNSEVDFSASQVRLGTVWNTTTYFLNFIIFLILWAIFILEIPKLMRYIVGK